MTHALLEVKNLVTSFRTSGGTVQAVKDVSFHVQKGETLCIVGESGCGKSITSLSVMRLLPSNGQIESGEILLDKEPLQTLSTDQMRKLRGKRMSMIFQEPMTALNPVLTIGYQLREPLMLHKGISKKDASKQGIELLRQVGIPNPEKRLNQYPHELSGGMRQRVMIAMSLACNPSLLIADEPTTALDVTIQAQILDLINDLKKDFDMGVMMITHDMGVIAETADRVAVMYAGRTAEIGPVRQVIQQARHPYTHGLMGSIPVIGGEVERLTQIDGSMPRLDAIPKGCAFNPRCSLCEQICREQEPPFIAIDADACKVACHMVHR